jgi:hypothetical protein
MGLWRFLMIKDVILKEIKKTLRSCGFLIEMNYQELFYILIGLCMVREIHEKNKDMDDVTDVIQLYKKLKQTSGFDMKFPWEKDFL